MPHSRKYSLSSSSSSLSSSSSSISSSSSSSSHHQRRRSRSRSIDQSLYNKPKEIKKGRGSFHKEDSSALLAWEDDDYINVNSKLKSMANQYKYNRHRKEVR